MNDQPFAGDEAETEELDLDSRETSIEEVDEVMKEALDVVEGSGAESRGDSDPFGSLEGESMEELHAKIKELRDRSMRTLADFDNFRKRVDRERSEQRRYAGGEVLRDLLAVIDNLERAAEAQGSADETRKGVELILRQTEELVKRHGVERVSATDERFDPSAHEAVVRHESDEVPEPTVVKELQAGYWLRDRLLRPALVEVAVPSDGAAKSAAENSDEEKD